MANRMLAAALIAAMVGGGSGLAMADETPPSPPFWMMYDLNHDSVVNYGDIAKFAEYWIMYHRDGVYTPAADFNGDDAIDYFDAMKMIGGVLGAMAASSKGAGSKGASARTGTAPGDGRPAGIGVAQAVVEAMVLGDVTRGRRAGRR